MNIWCWVSWLAQCWAYDIMIFKKWKSWNLEDSGRKEELAQFEPSSRHIRVFPFRNDSGQTGFWASAGLLRWRRSHCCGCRRCDLHVFSEIYGTRVTCQGWFWNQISSHLFRSIYVSFTFISLLHWMFTTRLAVEVWYVQRCRRAMSKGDRVTFLGCCEGTIDDFDKDGAPVCFGGGTYL